MATAWTFEGDTARLGGPLETVTLVEETTFCLSDRCGDIRPGGSHGLLFLDTRFVSALELWIAGTAPEVVAGVRRCQEAGARLVVFDLRLMRDFDAALDVLGGAVLPVLRRRENAEVDVEWRTPWELEQDCIMAKWEMERLVESVANMQQVAAGQRVAA